MNDTKHDDGGRAFPQMHRDPWGNYHHEGGMTLRDYFAAKAMQTLIGVYNDATEDLERVTPEHPALDLPQSHYHERVSKLAYYYADAMLKARKP